MSTGEGEDNTSVSPVNVDGCEVVAEVLKVLVDEVMTDIENKGMKVHLHPGQTAA